MKRNAIATTVAAAALMMGQQAMADQVILDDLIVDGSICSGMDCVNGESFGFDTIRLKENNLRIRAVDTSSTSSFPSRDWQITFNDSANGGANKFSIDDIDGGRTPFTLEAGAPSHSLYVDDGGRLGLGTSTPVVDIHSVSGNTPTLRLEQNGSSGFTPQTWDMASNEANFFIRDATNGSTLPFRIQPGAPSSALSIMSDGKIGMGTWSPSSKLHLLDASSGAIVAVQLDDADVQWKLQLKDNTHRLSFQATSATGTRSPIKLDSEADHDLLKIGVNASDRIDITGSLYINSTVVTPDYVFSPNYEIESIEEHALFMWKNKHLPGVTKHTQNGDGATVIKVGERSQQLLLELEKAHVFIERLNAKLVKLQNEKSELKVALSNIETRFSSLEHLILSQRKLDSFALNKHDHRLSEALATSQH